MLHNKEQSAIFLILTTRGIYRGSAKKFDTLHENHIGHIFPWLALLMVDHLNDVHKFSNSGFYLKGFGIYFVILWRIFTDGLKKRELARNVEKNTYASDENWKMFGQKESENLNWVYYLREMWRKIHNKSCRNSNLLIPNLKDGN